MSQRKLLAVVIVLCLGVATSVAWYLAGEMRAAEERAQSRPAPIRASQALPPGKTLDGRVALAPVCDSRTSFVHGS